MAITSTVDLVNTYDGNFQIQSSRILAPTESPEREAAAQCMAIETLRELLASGRTVQQYNDMTQAAWDEAVAAARLRARLNVNVPVFSLSATELEAAAGLGGSFFEHGYAAIMAGIAQEDKVTFTQLGGTAT